MSTRNEVNCGSVIGHKPVPKSTGIHTVWSMEQNGMDMAGITMDKSIVTKFFIMSVVY